MTLFITIIAWIVCLLCVWDSRKQHGPVSNVTLNQLVLFFGISFLLLTDVAVLLSEKHPDFDYSFLAEEPLRPNIYRAYVIIAGLIFLLWRKK